MHKELAGSFYGSTGGSAIKISGIMGVSIICSSVLALCSSISASTTELIVIYPQVREPFARVFEEIVRGAEDGYQHSVQRVPLAENQSPVDFVHVVDRQSPVLVLGNRLARQGSENNKEHNVIVGAVNTGFTNVFGITLTPNFDLLTSKLSLLVPAIKQVHVIAGANSGLTDFKLAKEAFLSRGITLLVHEADNLRMAAGTYRKLMHDFDEDDAIWILPSGSFVNNPMLSILLQESWKKRFVVFSSNPVHVKRGALFSVYPNNYKMGLSLGRLAQDIVQGVATEQQMQSLDDIFVTVNERTSNHLGVNLTEDVRAQIDVVLPAR